MNTLNKLSFIGLFAVALSLISCNKESPESVMSETLEKITKDVYKLVSL